ncbi:MAG: Gfo/Idh/MocA family oxidoreductase [Verrucomicrobiales bacterium]|nr:Gfo/Idh/MocA family oxidoreductase [Verrucomicrobiales bacterium]
MNQSNSSHLPARSRVNRRAFLRLSSTLAAGTAIVPAGVLGRGAQSPNNRLNIACIGVGGRGQASVNGVSRENIVALCDVDVGRAAKTRERFPRARFFQDFRRMFDALEGEIDAVTVATPDHTHAPVAMAAIRRGRHVYCEKPLAHSMQEVRTLTEAARAHNVRTQLGNQGHSTNSIREFVEMVRAGAIGTVTEVHAFVSSNYCPPSRVRPTATPPVPEGLDWDLWLGPAAPRPYHPLYHPGKWRGWWAFGTGVTGDWTCHVLDPIYWALDLGAPTRVVAFPDDYTDPQVRAETCPPSTLIRYEFPAKGDRPGVVVNWYEGNRPVPRPAALEPDRKLPGIGALIVGTEGTILHGSHGAAGAQLLPAARWQDYRLPAPSIPRSRGHHEDWLLACKGGEPASSSFDYGGPLTEVAMLGVIAQRFPGQPLEWDAPRLRIPNHAGAEALLRPSWREGWTL